MGDLRGRLWRTALLLTAALAGSCSGGRLQRHSFYSEALGRRMPYAVYLPPGYDPARRYPVVYFLHGAWDDYLALDRFGGSAILDRLIAEGELPPFLLAAPNGEGGFYMNFNDGTSRYEDYVMREFLPRVERAYPVAGSREGRFLFGISMGGYGAANLSTRYPQLFAAAAYVSAPMFGVEQIRRFIDVWWKRLLGIDRIFSDGGDRDFLVRNAPLDRIRDGRVDLQGMRVLLLYTEQDMEGVQPNNEAFHEVLVARGVPDRKVVVPGPHRWTAWNPYLGTVLRFLLQGE